MGGPIHSGSRAKVERTAAEGNAAAAPEREWLAAEATDRREAEQAGKARVRRALALVVPVAVVAALLPGIFPLTPAFSAADTLAAGIASPASGAGATGGVGVPC